MMKFTRRGFMRTSLLAGAGGSIAGVMNNHPTCAEVLPVDSRSDGKWDNDVSVVGDLGTNARILENRAVPMRKLIKWGDEHWRLQIDSATGGLVHIENLFDTQHMNWLRGAGRWDRRNWIPDSSLAAVTMDGQWGLVETWESGLLDVASTQKISNAAWEATYTSATLTVRVRRELDSNGDLAETYTFVNTGVVPLKFPVGAVAITAPFFDQYADAKECLTSRCHAHVWMGGSSAWINAMRMGGAPPHLGLVATEGSLDAYSQRGGTFNDRGVFLIHPAAMTLGRGETSTMAWKLFWHNGWDDFWGKLKTTESFVQMRAEDYVVSVGQPLMITADSAMSLESAQVFANGTPVATRHTSTHLAATIPADSAGEVLIELRNNTGTSWLRANVTIPIDDLIDARVRFIVRHQQEHDKGGPLDGAYLIFDNETGQRIYDANIPDHNAGRERLAMGVLGALYFSHCQDAAFKAELKQSLMRYADFVARELEDQDGVVYGGVGRVEKGRAYNALWVAQFHLAMYHATADSTQLNRFVRGMRAYYADGGTKHYGIDLPISDGLRALDEAHRTEDRTELLSNLRAHADYILKNGANYPRSEVNYEQSIVAPAVQILAEMYVVTGDNVYLEGAKQQMPLLEAFCGKQPDSRLYEVGIRHWDDYWFGKLAVYGDTLPHYWSTINALAYTWYGIGTKDPSWFQRANTVIKANLSLFAPDGSASCAHLYAHSTNGRRANRNDPWANDQDWALVHLLLIRDLRERECARLGGCMQAPAI